MSFKDDLDSFIRYVGKTSPISTITIAITPNYCRRCLGLKKRDALAYRGFALKCIGSKKWREKQYCDSEPA